MKISYGERLGTWEPVLPRCGGGLEGVEGETKACGSPTTCSGSRTVGPAGSQWPRTTSRWLQGDVFVRGDAGQLRGPWAESEVSAIKPVQLVISRRPSLQQLP